MPVRKTKTENPKPMENGKVIASVVEEIETNNGRKTLNYDAPLDEVKNNDNQDEFETEDFTNNVDDLEFTENTFQEIPKTQIEIMFDELNIISNGQPFTYYAMISRLPDNMSDSFRVSCNADSPAPLGKFQFNSRDILNFDSAIQRLNQNSGGRFNVAVYDSQGKPVEMFIRSRSRFGNESYRIGITNLYIPNPVMELTENDNKKNNSNDDKLLAFMQQSDAKFFALMEKLGQPKEKSEIEKALEQATLQRLINPPKPETNNNSFEQTMATIMAMPVMVEKMAGKMFPDNAEPEKKEWYDKVLEFAETEKGSEIAKGVVTAVSNVPILAANAFSNKKGNTPNLPAAPAIDNTPIIQNAQNLPEAETIQETEIDDTDDMKLQETILDELESDSILDWNNPMLIDLKNNHVIAFLTAQSLCKTSDFQTVLNTIHELKPEVFDEYTTLTDNGLIYNEQGLYVKARLEIVYNLLRES